MVEIKKLERKEISKGKGRRYENGWKGAKLIIHKKDRGKKGKKRRKMEEVEK